MLDQLKQFIKSNESELILMLGVILVSLISFAAGRLTASGPQKQPIAVETFSLKQFSATSSQQAFIVENSVFKNIISSDSMQVRKRTQEKSQCANDKTCFVGSKNSTKYHLPNCPGAKRIAEHNRIWFNSKEEAESLGYEPASNCPGL